MHRAQRETQASLRVKHFSKTFFISSPLHVYTGTVYLVRSDCGVWIKPWTKRLTSVSASATLASVRASASVSASMNLRVRVRLRVSASVSARFVSVSMSVRPLHDQRRRERRTCHVISQLRRSEREPLRRRRTLLLLLLLLLLHSRNLGLGGLAKLERAGGRAGER